MAACTALAGEMLGLKLIYLDAGSGAAVTLSNDDFINNKEKYLQPYDAIQTENDVGENYSYITFEAKVFDSVNFFASLDIPPFVRHILWP